MLEGILIGIIACCIFAGIGGLMLCAFIMPPTK